MASKDIERALELRAGDIVFYSSSSLSSWFNKLGQRLLHKERVEMTHVAIALSARLILEANPMGSEENQKGLAQETKLSYPRDFEKIRCVFRNPNKTEVSVAAIPRGAMFFRGEEYNHLKIFTSQLLQPLKRTREAEQYGKTFCSALVQGVAEKCNLIPALPTGTLLTPHALMKHLETLGWERIEGSRFIRSATEEAEEKRMQETLVSGGFDPDILARTNELDATVAEHIEDLMSKSEPALRDMLSVLTASHRVIAERRKLEDMLKQVDPERHKAMAKLLERHVDQPEKFRKIASLALSVHKFPFDLLNMVPLVAQLQSVQRIADNIAHYSIANEINALEKMKLETVQWLTDDLEVYEREAHEWITNDFYDVLELYLRDDIQEKMKKDPELQSRMAKWEKGTDQIATLTMNSALAQGLSVSTSREKLLELKHLCTSVLMDEKLRSRVENLLAERENYLRVLEDWLEFRSAQAEELSMVKGNEDAS